jgi:hypothetical protein
MSDDPQEVKITGVSIPFMDLVVLLVRIGVAAIPAAMLVTGVVFLLLMMMRFVG